MDEHQRHELERPWSTGTAGNARQPPRAPIAGRGGAAGLIGPEADARLIRAALVGIIALLVLTTVTAAAVITIP